MMVRLVSAAAVLLVVSLAGNTAQSQEKPDFAETLQKYGTPGPEHKFLQPMVGKWEAEVKMYDAPGSEPTVSKGTSTVKWALGKRYLMDQFKGEFGGQSFEGMGITGYDRKAGKYVSTWMDTMSTGIMESKGTYDKKTKTFTFTGVEDSPYANVKMNVRDVIRIVNKNQYTIEMYRNPVGTDKEMKVMEVNYTRVPGKKKKNN